MDHLTTLTVIVLMAPLAAIVVILNMAKTDYRRLQKMRERADEKKGRRL